MLILLTRMTFSMIKMVLPPFAVERTTMVTIHKVMVVYTCCRRSLCPIPKVHRFQPIGNPWTQLSLPQGYLPPNLSPTTFVHGVEGDGQDKPKCTATPFINPICMLIYTTKDIAF